MASGTAVELAVVMVVGDCRDRAQRALDALCAQSALNAMEIVVVDVAKRGAPPLVAPADAPVEIVSHPALESWGEARRAGFDRTSAPAIAFVEEHCVVDPAWAAALLEAHQGPWASVGYAFRNANPESYVSRAAMLTDYGLWLEPAPRGRTSLLASNNVSYKREALLGLGDRLDEAIGSDFVAQEALSERGLPMFLESRAVVSHENFTTVRETGLANYAWCRTMAGRRAAAAGWSLPRRIAQAAVTPISAPAFRTLRLARTLGRRRPLWQPFLLGLPVFLVVSVWAGIGEAVGYLLGTGSADTAIKRWELDVERDARG